MKGWRLIFRLQLLEELPIQTDDSLNSEHLEERTRQIHLKDKTEREREKF